MITGSQVNDSILGNGGLDVLRGLGGSDFPSGGSSVRVIGGGTGNETITGFFEADELSDGLGADRFLGQLTELLGDVILGGDGFDKVVDPGNSDITLGSSLASWKGFETLDLSGHGMCFSFARKLTG